VRGQDGQRRGIHQSNVPVRAGIEYRGSVWVRTWDFAGRMTAADLMRAIRAGHGTARLTTVQGGMLTARMRGRMIVLTDARGGMATVTQADVIQSNGVIHVTNAVSLPG